MKLKTNHLFPFVISILFFQASQAQFKLPGAANPDMRNALEKVIGEFPKDLASLRGEVLNTNPQTVEYESLLSFKTAERNVIVQHSGKPPVYTWQAQMATLEEFEAAAKKYKALYSQLKGMNLKLNRDYDYSLTGDYGKPDESKKFCTSVFQLSPSATYLPKVKVELSMQYELMEWKIYIAVYKKEREDNERGKIEETPNP